MNSLSFINDYWVLQPIATEKVVFLIERQARSGYFLGLTIVVHT